MVSIRDYLSPQIGSTLRKESWKSCFDLTSPPTPSEYFKDFFDNYEFRVLDYADSLEKDLFEASFYCSEKANYIASDLGNTNYAYGSETINEMLAEKNYYEEKARFFLAAMRTSVIERMKKERRENIVDNRIALNNDFQVVVFAP